MKEHSCSGTTLAQQKILAIHNGSHIISKQKPIIRIIHIVAPEIIKTDVEGFRDLVQKLTGNKPLEKRSSSSSSPKFINKDKKNVTSSKLLQQQPKIYGTNNNNNNQNAPSKSQRTTPMKREYCDHEGRGGSSLSENNNSNPNSFLSFLGDGLFMHDVNHEFPLLSFKSSFGDHMPLCASRRLHQDLS